jgi:predicted amidophosphoribosyltransferase
MKCSQEKAFSGFHKDKKKRDGLAIYCKVCVAQYRKDNIEDYLKKEADYRNKNRDQRRSYISSYKKIRRGYYNALEKNRRTLKDKAMPSWLSQEQRDQINAIYEHARDCELVTGEPYHVDHVVPLKGEFVCGLHVPWNLQVLPADVNLHKSNKANDQAS